MSDIVLFKNAEDGRDVGVNPSLVTRVYAIKDSEPQHSQIVLTTFGTVEVVGSVAEVVEALNKSNRLLRGMLEWGFVEVRDEIRLAGGNYDR